MPARARRIHTLARVLLVGGLLIGSLSAAATESRALDHGWQVRLAANAAAAAKKHPGASRWIDATVPGSVQMDLLHAGLIPDPFLRDNEATLQWIGLTDWDYRLDFDVDAATLARDHVDLVFDGLDTFADVRLNGKKVLVADNMFRRWRIAAKSALHVGSNTLTISLHSPIARLQPWLLKQAYALPGEFDSAFGDEPAGKQTSNYVRKANYQYGWDWGPRFITEGIWQPVKLESWNTLRLTDLHIAQQHVDADSAKLQAQVAVTADHAGEATVRLSWRAPDGHTGQTASEMQLAPGENTLSLPLTIDQPQRWWPVGYGKPNLYAFHAEVLMDGKVLAKADRDTGLRSVELRRDKDRWGRSFAFVVNGIPIFAKGANLIPFDSFPSRVTDAQMDQVLGSARDAHMNMLRVWGGGTYLDDAFYAMADRMGLMIWQDFMFGGAIPPYDKAFRDNAKQEAIEQVTRLRDHPSIVLWCGNNEVQTGWESWPDRAAFRKQIGPAETAKVEQGMRELFDHTLREVVKREQPDVPYWATTPGTDMKGPANVPDDGDMHYWDVWSGKAKPAEAYLDITPRFQSEYGLQSMPVMKTIRAFAGAGDLSVNSKVMRAHQKYDKGNGNERLLKYIRRGYGEPKSFSRFVYLSQLMQADGIELAVDHLRSQRPRTMGSLYWQLNDVWPGASWSSIDWYGRWKALQFHARRFYAPVRVAPIRHHGRTQVYLISDRTQPIDAQLRVRVMSMDGTVRYDHTEAAKIAPLASTRVLDLTDAALLHGGSAANTIAVFELLQDGKLLSRHLLYFDSAPKLQLPDPALSGSLVAHGDGYRLTVQARRFARGVWIDFGDRDAKLSDNAFDLLPGQSMTLDVHSDASIAALRTSLRLHSLADATSAPDGTPRTGKSPH
ncbi:MAG: glycoside hydrolase family 2 protein [Pseudomonadota bacterium]|nr:glycoside hydrolase family 2 protein [Pseudomonadota bacterium]